MGTHQCNCCPPPSGSTSMTGCEVWRLQLASWLSSWQRASEKLCAADLGLLTNTEITVATAESSSEGLTHSLHPLTTFPIAMAWNSSFSSTEAHFISQIAVSGGVVEEEGEQDWLPVSVLITCVPARGRECIRYVLRSACPLY